MSTPTTISAFPAPISAPVKPPEEGEEEEVVVHHHDVPFLPQGGWIAEKLGLLGTGLRQVFNSWRSAVTGRQSSGPTAPRISTRDSGSDTSSSDAAPLPPLAGNTGAEDVPIAKKVVNAAHSVMEHLGQEAAAVTGTLKDEADELKGSHPLHTTPEHLAPPAGAGSGTSHAGGEHMSVAGKVTNAMHSTLDHLAQDTEAVSSSVKEELSSFQHHHAVSPAGAHV